MLPVASPLRISGRKTDWLIAFLVGLAALAVYLFTLTPSVASGDVAELQYIPSRLGIPHPNGFPLYLLAAKAWSLLPLGSLAWRMNLLSAVFGALGVAAMYALLRVSGLPRVASAAAALFWGFQRTYWAWATLADRYTLLFLLVTGAFAALLAWRRTNRPAWLWLAALLAGCTWATHVAAPLFVLPMAILLLWPRGRGARTLDGSEAAKPRPGPRIRPFLLAAALFAAPLLLYAYVPLRGASLWHASPVDPLWRQPLVVLQGIVHPRFQPDAATIQAYFRAGNPINPARLLADFAGRRQDLLNLLKGEFGLAWAAVAILGLLRAARRNLPWGLALLVLLVTDTVLAAQYWQGNVEAYFLPAMLALSVGLGEVGGWLQTVTVAGRRPAALSAAVAIAILALPLAPLSNNHEPEVGRDSVTLENYWREVLALPLEKNAGLLAHWSDLTPLWYFQQADGLRTDVQGLYLPEMDRVQNAVEQGRAVYLSGPLYGWYPDLPARVRLVPWGPLVQLADPAQPPPAPPAMPSAPQRVSFGDVLELEAATLPQAAIAPGATAPISLTWRSLAPVSAKMHISLRLRRDGRKVSQQDDRVVSPWFPSSQVDPGLDFWSEHNLRAPVGMPDGEYELVAVVYDLDGPELKPSTGESEVQLGSVRVGPEEGTRAPLSLAPTLGPCIRVEQERPLDLQATVGSLLDLELLFVKRCQPADGTALRFILAGGGKTHPLPDATEQALEWRSGAHQREAMKVRIPADIAAGGYEIRVQAVDGNGRALPRQVGPVPLPSEETLGTLHVSSRPFETTVPPLAHVSGASFDNGIRLLGFDRTPDGAGATAPITVTLVWRADRPIGAGYNTFVHLLGPGGSIAAQRDAPPGELPTQAWLPGEVVSTTLTLQAAQPLTSGEYRLIAGLYDSATLQRSPVKLPDVSNASDYVDLGTLRLVQ